MKRTPLVRKGWPRGRSARVLAKKDELARVTPALLERAKYRCEMCRLGRVEHRHHKLRRSQGGDNSLDNLMALCHICHEFVHHNPSLSYEMGWMKKSGFHVDMPVGEE